MTDADSITALSCLRAMIYISSFVSGDLLTAHRTQLLFRHVETCKKCKQLLRAVVTDR